ncbi:hypothetical protein BDP27DRAFT_1323948 [Rhodocollybia butyracea]|uniref:Uncharacterized protein n=1 Tax=Rhodocollybia butyracea TaxID=206335 RepID=A0A9P5U7X8_9AGAR|nr:hypothetical protein BDP27DRAFT_1323948 [Rhodocollybia butyracea]
MATYPFSSQNITPYPQQQYLYTHPKPPQPGLPSSKPPTVNFAQTSKAPSPSPPPEPSKNWDHALKTFLESIGMTKALRGFELDMLVLNSDWEKQKVPGALQELATSIQKIQRGQYDERPVEERKLDHIQLSKGSEPQTPTTLTKSISKFLAQKRAINDASNRDEFLRSLADQRTSSDSSSAEASSSCARTDAKAVDRSAQIKYDITKHEDGPLRRTMRNRDSTVVPSTSSTAKGKAKAVASSPKTENAETETKVLLDLASERHPGLDERLTNIETHLSVRYVPHPPQSLLDRLRFLEDHIIRIEKDYPPWAAIHFNQPNRNWPPPPKQTPIIVPPNLSRQQPKPDTASASSSFVLPNRGKNSSLHRAVMERLEVQNAKLDLSSGR